MIEIEDFEFYGDEGAEDRVRNLIKQRDELLEALKSIKLRVDSCKGNPVFVDDVFDSFYCDFISESIANAEK